MGTKFTVVCVVNIPYTQFYLLNVRTNLSNDTDLANRRFIQDLFFCVHNAVKFFNKRIINCVQYVAWHYLTNFLQTLA